MEVFVTNRRRLSIANMVMAFGLSALAGWYAAMMLRTTLAAPAHFKAEPQAASAFAKSFDPLAIARIFRSDLPSVFGAKTSPKAGPTDHDRVSFGGLEQAVLHATSDVAQVSATPGDDGATIDQSIPADQESAGQSGNAEAVAPILRLNPSGQIEIDDFKTLGLDNGTCLEMGYALLDDLGASRKLLEIVGQSKQITIGRICAANGSVIISCRGSQTTFSPRRARPDDNCTRA
jgi:hypothetical protein